MINKFARLTSRYVRDNAPTILASFGVVGTVTTAVLSARAGYRAAEIIEQERQHQMLDPRFSNFTPRHKAELTWQLYIPPTLTGVASCGLIIASVVVGNRRAAALAAAYSLSEKAFREYKDKVVDQIGKGKERKIRDELAQDRVNQDPVSRQDHIYGPGSVLCYDAYTGRYFYSDMESLRRAQNELNHRIINSYYASLSDLYDILQLHRTAFSDEVGWNCDRLLEMTFSTTMSDDDRPCIVINFQVEPIRHYDRIQ